MEVKFTGGFYVITTATIYYTCVCVRWRARKGEYERQKNGIGVVEKIKRRNSKACGRPIRMTEKERGMIYI